MEPCGLTAGVPFKDKPSQPSGQRPVGRINPKMKKIVFCLFFILFLILPLEITSRAYWTMTQHVSFLFPEAMYLFYPALKTVQTTKITKDDGYYDILFLGGSVLYDAGTWERAVALLQEKLKSKTTLPIRIHNVARPSHSSRDSLFKYRFLKDKSFDLIILYDSINEVRANNCPPQMYKNDYSHYSWYAKLNFFEHYHFFKIFTLPYTIYSLSIDIKERLGWIPFVPTDIPKDEWVQYGNKIKSATAFEQNLDKILNVAQQRHERVLMASFAFHVPRDYTYFKFKTKQLDYAAHSFYIEIWGKPENVIAGIITHNAMMAKLAAKHPEIIFLDEYPNIPKGKLYFNDICHLTEAGNEKLLTDFAEAVTRAP